MGLIGSLLGGVGSIFGGLAASKAMNEVKDNVKVQMRDNKNWFDKRYNEDATQRADAQRVLAMTEESIKKRNKQAAGTAAVMGGSDEALIAQKEANGKALADATSQIAAAGEAQKSAIENQYMQRKSELNGQLNDLSKQKAQAIAQATQGLTSMAGQLPI